MRLVLHWQQEGQSESEIIARLTGPEYQRSEDYAQHAYDEAQRSLQFRELLSGDTHGQTLGELWDQEWLNIFRAAYGRLPTVEETPWAMSRPGDFIGLTAELTVEGVEGFAWTPTLNAPWDATVAEIQQQVEEWFQNRSQSPPPGRSVEEAIAGGAAVHVGLIGGALVPRIEPTIVMGRE